MARMHFEVQTHWFRLVLELLPRPPVFRRQGMAGKRACELQRRLRRKIARRLHLHAL
jgi:hypothetical protein